MKRIKYGLKLRTNEAELMKEAVELIDDGSFSYIELLINPQSPDITPFFDFNAEYTVHTSHENCGVDIGNPEQNDFTLKMLDISLRFADELDANSVILHAGTNSLAHAKEILSNYDDPRIAIENMPKVGLNGEACLGYDVQTMKILTEGRFGVCLDFGHAVKASLSLKKDYQEIISDFLKLDTRLFHISDGDLKTVKDNHLNITEGEFDIRYFKNCVHKSRFKEVTLETPRQNTKSLEEDLRNLRALLKI